MNADINQECQHGATHKRLQCYAFGKNASGKSEKNMGHLL